MRVDFLLDYDVITVAREQKLYLMARLAAGPAPHQTERRPLNLSLVIDRSGSMAGSKIDYTRQAAGLLVQNLATTDRFSVVLYNEAVETFLPPQHVTHKDVLRQRIDRIRAGGTTNLSAGWLEGVSHVHNHLNEQHVNRVILMSDGLANRGITDTDKLVAIARQKRESGVSTTTMGLGDDFNEDLLIALADAGGGAFYFIESPEVAPDIFKEELSGLLTLVGQNLVISITPTHHITHLRQMNSYPEERQGAATAFRVGDVYGEEVKTLMLELTIPAIDEIGAVEIATLRFEYDELHDDGTERKAVEVGVTVNIADAELAPGANEANPEVMRAALLLEAAAARREAIKLADAGSFKEAAKVLRAAAERIRLSGMDSDQVLQEERGALIAQATDMDAGAERYDSYSRKSMSTQSYSSSLSKHNITQALRQREKARRERTTADSPDRKTHHFKNPLQNVEAEAPPPPMTTSSLPPTHMRWQDQLFPLKGDLIRIGRAPQNDIVLNISGISRFHCHITRSGERLTLEDLQSTNGTHINNQRLDQPHTLHEGDVAYLCDQRVVFERH
jgi:Ca-activated chloride channel homolog